MESVSSKASTASTSKKRKGSEVAEPTPIRKSPRKTPEKDQRAEKQNKKVLEEDDIEESEEELENKKKKSKQVEGITL